MTEIKRYLVSGGEFEVTQHSSGDYVEFEDHAAIVSALQEQVQRYSMSAGQADQRKAESDAARVALGLSADADDVAPCDLVDAIVALHEQVRALTTERDASRKAIADIYKAVIGGRPGWSNWDAYLDDIVEEVSTALREIRAQAIEVFAEHIAFYHSDSKSHALDYAARIRAGEQP